MTSPIDPDTDANRATPPHYPPTTPSNRTRTAGHIAAIVVGCLVLLPGLGLLAGGGTIAIAQSVAADDDGYFSFTLDRIESEGVAVASTDLWFDDAERHATPWVVDWLDLDLRLRVDGARATDDVFVGIARAADVEDYLGDAAYSRVVELDEHTPTYREVEGVGSVASPLDQDFWTVSSAGANEQEIVWDARSGRWSVVVMNADGSPVVAADVEIGARSGAIGAVSAVLLVTGGMITLTAIVLIVIGARGRRTPGASDEDATPTAPLPPPDPGTAARTGDDRRPTAVG